METLQGWEAEAMLERTIGEDAEGTFVLCWPLLTPRGTILALRKGSCAEAPLLKLLDAEIDSSRHSMLVSFTPDGGILTIECCVVCERIHLIVIPTMSVSSRAPA